MTHNDPKHAKTTQNETSANPEQPTISQNNSKRNEPKQAKTTQKENLTYPKVPKTSQNKEEQQNKT